MLETLSSQSTEEAYIKWLNDHLAKATPPLIVSDLTEENICNGVAIGVLLEIIGGIKIDGLLLQPITIVERLHNIHEVFSVLRRLNVKLNNIQPEDIMEGDKETVHELLIAINDYFTPKAVNKSTKKLFTNNNHIHDVDYKLDSNGRTSAWSNMSTSTRRTPISRPDTATLTSLNGNHDNGVLPSHHHSQKNLLHSTNGIDYPPTIDLPWSNSSDQLTDTRQAYSYHHSLAPTPTPSELTNSTSPRSKCNMYRVRSDPISPRYSHSKRRITDKYFVMGNSNNRFFMYKEYNTLNDTPKYQNIKTTTEKEINTKYRKYKLPFNSIVKYVKHIDHGNNDVNTIDCTEYNKNDQICYCKHKLINKKSVNTSTIDMLSLSSSIEHPSLSPTSEHNHYLWNSVCNCDCDYNFHSYQNDSNYLVKKSRKNVCLIEMQKLYSFMTRRLCKSDYFALKTNDQIETSSSTTPINIRSALPNLNSGSRGYYSSQGSTKYHDRNGYVMRNGRPTSELPHLYDSMNEIQQLKSQLNSLSKLIESDGSNPIRTAAALSSTVTKSTQTEFGYLLDSDSLKTILYNMNKPNNLDKTTMSNNYSIRHQDYPDFYDLNKSASLNSTVVKPHHHHHHRQQQQQHSVQHQQNYRNQALPRHHHNDPNHLQQQKRTHTPINSTTNLNTPMIISPSQLSTMKSHACDQQPRSSSTLPRSISPCKSDNSVRQISPVRQQSPERLKEIRRQLSPTGKRFPYYQPYIHLLMHSNEQNKVEKHKCSAEPKTRGLTTAQSQIVKSPTQRLLMQSLPTTGY
ncbi:Dixin [Schistosoma japonicum]|nr:Dixin [Schistosoma japonicum]KAH8856462.1 Dixin [Schistosoma japonicum]